jgi:hypothetical protein
MDEFFVLTIGMYTQYRFAYYDVCDKPSYSSALTCPKCSAYISRMKWQPPYNVNLKQPRYIGDFVAGAGGSDFLCSKSFISLYQSNQLIGIDRYFPVTICKMGTTKKAMNYLKPSLFGIDLIHSYARVVFKEMGTKWREKPKEDYCRFCGPGGGGKGGSWGSIDQVIIDKSEYNGEDIFYAINFAGTILISKRMAKLIADHKLTNCTITPCSKYRIEF